MGKRTNVLITGANGQLGLELQEALSGVTDLQVCAADRSMLDVSSSESVQKAFQKNSPDIVINCAAFTAVDLAEEQEKKCYDINATGPLLLADAAKECGAWVLQVSTDYVFDGQGEVPYQENDATNPQSVYGKSKLAGEKNLLRANPASCVLRTSWLYAARGKNFVLTMKRLGETMTSIKVVDDQVSSPTFTKHLANAIKKIIILGAGQQGYPRGIFHFSNDGTTSWFEFAQKIMNITGSTCEVLPVSTQEFGALAPRPAFSKLDCSKIYDDYGIEAVNWEEALQECLQEINEIEDKNNANG